MTHGPEFLDVVEIDEARDLPAGRFGDWLEAFGESLRRGRHMVVPCGPCNACCRSGYFIHIGAAEHETLARIPQALLVSAPGRPDDRVMGFDSRGRCPMLVDDACSIYEHRPLTCRRYDCRVFAAAGTVPEEDKADLGARARRWRFTYQGGEDERRHAATVTAARLLDEHRARLGAAAPVNRTEQAVRAVARHSAVLALDDRYRRSGEHPAEAEILAAISTAADIAAGGG